jgi:hypothetical protein
MTMQPQTTGNGADDNNTAADVDAGTQRTDNNADNGHGWVADGRRRHVATAHW